jgi:hypothetical protein
MSLNVENLDQAINLLMNIVKYSAIEGQKHIDLSICLAEERHVYQKALMITQLEVEKGTLTQDQLKKRLGLI